MWSPYIRIRFQIRTDQICKTGSPTSSLFKNWELIILEGKSNAKYFPHILVVYRWGQDSFDRVVRKNRSVPRLRRFTAQPISCGDLAYSFVFVFSSCCFSFSSILFCCLIEWEKCHLSFYTHTQTPVVWPLETQWHTQPVPTFSPAWTWQEKRRPLNTEQKLKQIEMLAHTIYPRLPFYCLSFIEGKKPCSQVLTLPHMASSINLTNQASRRSKANLIASQIYLVSLDTTWNWYKSGGKKKKRELELLVIRDGNKKTC